MIIVPVFKEPANSSINSEKTTVYKKNLQFLDVFASSLVLPIHLLSRGPTLEASRARERKQNSNAFIKSIREQERHSKEGARRTAPPSSPSLHLRTLEASVIVCMWMDGDMEGPGSSKDPLHVSAVGKCWGPHQRAVLTLPA